MSEELDTIQNSFLEKKYKQTIIQLQQQLQYTSAEQLPLIYDALACSNMMIGKYEIALNFQNFAIQLNPHIADFYINKGAILRNLNENQKSLQALNKAKTMVDNPAINYNLRLISRSQSQKNQYNQQIKQKQHLNKDYAKYNGLVPSFLKINQSRTDYIYNQQNQLINLILNDKISIDNFNNYLHKIYNHITIRQDNYKKYGVHFKMENRQLIANVKKIINMNNNIQKNIQFNFQKQELYNLLFDLFIQLKRQFKDLDGAIDQEIVNTMFIDIISLYHLKSKKQLHPYKNQQSFKQAIKKIQKSQRLYEKYYIIGPNKQKPKISMIVTENNSFLHLQMDFIGCLTPKRGIKILKKLPKQTSKILFNLYWFICLRIVFNHEQGVDIKQFLEYRDAFKFIYQQIEDCQEYKISSDDWLNQSIYIFEKYNEIFKINFIDKKTKKLIYQNCQKFKNSIWQVDQNYQSILKKQIYINTLTKSQNTGAQQYFRKTFNLHKQLNYFIVQDLTIIFLQFGKQFYLINQILIQAFPQIGIQTSQQINGKNLFFNNYYQFTHQQQRQSFVKKMVKKIISS